MASRPQIGQLLVQAGLIDSIQLQAALGHQRRWGSRLGEACVYLGFFSEEQVLPVLAKQHGVEFTEIGDRLVESAVLRRIPERLQRARNVLPLRLDAAARPSILEVAAEEPWNVMLQDELSFAAGCRVRLVLAGREDILRSIDKHHGPNRPAA
jgi:type IV pilus assembly protein PilB